MKILHCPFCGVARRHLTTFAKCSFADAWRDHETQAARVRQGARTDLQLDGNSSIKSGRNPEQPSRDKIGERVGVSGRSIDKFQKIHNLRI